MKYRRPQVIDNGNLIRDKNKNITSITYNYLNLPQIITFGTGGYQRIITFIYDASGVKLRKITREVNNVDGGTDQITDYQNGVEYKNGVTNRIAHTEGAVVLQSTGSGVSAYKHEFVLRDHLGNTRVTFSDLDGDGIVTSADIKQINHYYPFGLNMEGNWNGAAGTNKYQYNGKEWNDDFGLGWFDYGARFYDAAVARWWNIDPLVDTFPHLSPYNYSMNSPIRFKDPNGKSPKDIVILLNPNGAGGSGKSFGHMGMLVGNDKSGWVYISKDGRHDGDGNILKGGKSEWTLTKFDTKEQFDNQKSELGLGGYTKEVRFSTTEKQDAEAIKAGITTADKDYKLVGSNCADVCSDALQAAGLNPGTVKTEDFDYITQSIKTSETMSPKPNSRFEAIKNNNNDKIIKQ